MQKLGAKLAAERERQRVEESEEIRGERVEASWGFARRSYVLDPYRQVRDKEAEFETTDVKGFLDGDIGDCLKACVMETQKNNFE